MPAARGLFRDHPRRVDVPLALAASAGLLAGGLTLPLLEVEKLVFWEQRYSVATGVFGLWSDGEWLLAAVVFFFSVVFPIAKLLLLTCIWFAPADRAHRARLLELLARLGKWSMLDVFIVAILVVATKLGSVASVEALPGVYLFAGAILGSMVATELVRRIADPGAR